MTTAESDWSGLLESLRGSRVQIALVVTGGGSGALAKCFRRVGASDNFVEAVVPYSRAALKQYLGSDPTEGSASPAMAKQLAAVSFRRAARLSDAGDGTGDASDAVGVALVAALPTHPPRRGADRIHLALCSERRSVLWSVRIAKGVYSREAAETIADQMVYRALEELADQGSGDQFFRDAGLDLVRAEWTGPANES